MAFILFQVLSDCSRKEFLPSFAFSTVVGWERDGWVRVLLLVLLFYIVIGTRYQKSTDHIINLGVVIVLIARCFAHALFVPIIHLSGTWQFCVKFQW